MAKEDESPKCCRIGGTGRASKKPKQQKVPQRGLGVAQLEKIRLEEEQRDAAAAIASSTKSSNDLHIQFPNFHYYNQPSSPISFPSSSVQGHVRVPQFWSSHELKFEKERLGMYPCESNPIRPHPNLVKRTQYQQYTSSMVSVSTGTSSTPVPHSFTEPPSNQNFSVSYVPTRPKEKMKGIKRQNPFSQDAAPVSSFNFNPPIFPAPMKESETISFGSGSGFKLDVGNSTLREVPSLLASNSELISKKSNTQNKNFDGDFLTLAPPGLTSCTHSKLKSPPTFLAFHHHGHPDFGSLSSQGIMEDQISPPSVYNQFNQQQQHLCSFFPLAEKVAQIGQQSERIQNCNAVEESVDLNLKL